MLCAVKSNWLGVLARYFTLDNLYPLGYNTSMSYQLHATKDFNKWLKKLRDKNTKIKILARLDRMENGNFGDYKQVQTDLFELRFFFGGGLRIYYTIRDNRIIFLLVGGNKSSQQRDIQKAQSMLLELE